jgi:hypothetical protein
MVFQVSSEYPTTARGPWNERAAYELAGSRSGCSYSRRSLKSVVEHLQLKVPNAAAAMRGDKKAILTTRSRRRTRFQCSFSKRNIEDL